ncbi:MAG: GH32 C-terminal domain-containing protein [Planctomycetales bacterium]|nr:GH32 C-terminal domain-containing protein [Planctomycetales bacterium]
MIPKWIFFVWIVVGCYCFPDQGCASDPSDVLTDAVACWHFESLDDSAGGNSKLQIHGAASVGSPLAGVERQQSLVRGGDGYAAKLSGGWFDAGKGIDGELKLQGDHFSALIRVKCDADTLWSTRGFFTVGGGHDELIFNFFSHDFDRGQAGMRVGCEIGVDGRSGLAGQVMVPLAQIGSTRWHDLLVRYDSKELVFFVDGVAIDRKPVSGRLRQSNQHPLCIGAGGASDNPFVCWIDHAVVWNRALSDEEVIALTGGTDAVRQAKNKFDSWVAPAPQTPIDELVRHSRELDTRLMNDPSRPRYHLMHFEGGDIMPGDPNGAIYWKGRYHLFYIFQRHQSEQPTTVHCWGHASSVDLVHWTHHPTALDVAPTDPDRGIFSGNALVSRDGIPTLIYHGVGIGNCSATSTDDMLIHWEKSAANPMVPIPKPEDASFGKYDSWDPHLWLQDDGYRAIFGGNPGTGAPPTLFRGANLDELNYVGPFLPTDRWSQEGEDVSCPDFFSLDGPGGGRHMLLCISHMRGARYFLGDWADDRFSPQSHGRMNWPGGCFFAPETLVDHLGRRILWGWCLDERPATVRRSSGATGVMSLPRVLSLDDDGALRIEPPTELNQLRINPVSLPATVLASGAEHRLSEVAGDSLEIQVSFPADDHQVCGIKVRQSPDQSEETMIIYDRDANQLTIDFSKSTLDPAIRYRSWCLFRPKDPEDADRAVRRQDAPLNLRSDEPLQLTVYLDRSMLEVFANGRQCMSQRIWPTRNDSRFVSLVNTGPNPSTVSVKAWEMAASNQE